MNSVKTGKIYGINGPVIYLKGRSEFKMSEMVYVGSQKLVGEVIGLDKDLTTIQVYEETSETSAGRRGCGNGCSGICNACPGNFG